jgi:Tol biopolymer transport system component
MRSTVNTNHTRQYASRLIALYLAFTPLLGYSIGPADPVPHYRHPVVFCRGRAAEHVDSKIWIMEDDGSALRQLTVGESYDDHPSLYSDLRHILYAEFASKDFDVSAGSRLIKLDVYTGTREVVGEVAGCTLHHAQISPIGDLLVYSRNCGQRFSEWVGWGPGAYEVNTWAVHGVAVPGGIIFQHEKNWTEDGADAARESSIVRLWGHGRGSKIVFLTDDRHLNRRPAVSPDGRLIAWQTNQEANNDEIFLANIDGSNARNITNSPGYDGHPWFSRDGKTIVFESDRTGAMEIWKISLNTNEVTQLTFGGKGWTSNRPRM